MSVTNSTIDDASIDRWCIFVFILFMIYIYIQHQYIYFYHDDYALAKLKYIYVSNVDNNEIHIPDIFSYITKLYFKWTGRVIFAFIYILILQYNIFVWRIVNTIIITLLVYLSYKVICSNLQQKNRLSYAIIICLLYGLIDVMVAREGMYWGGSSSVYIWPLMLLFGMVNLQHYFTVNPEKLTRWRCLPVILLSFIVGASHEQISISAIVYIVTSLIYDFIAKKSRHGKIVLLFLLPTILGFVFLVLAPGNFARNEVHLRAGQHDSFIEGSIRVFYVLISGPMAYYWIIISLLLLWHMINDKGSKCRKIYYATGIFINIISIPIFIALKLYPVKTLISYYGYNVVAVSGILFGVIYIIYNSLIIYQLISLNVKVTALFISGLMSIFIMILAPIIGFRSIIPLIFVINVVIVYLLNHIFLASKMSDNILKYIVIGIAIISLYNASNIFIGYKNNSVILSHNVIQLHNARRDVDAGDFEQHIVLKKLVNEKYANAMPYQKEFTYITPWMLSYYGLPVTTHIDWVSGE